MTTSGNVTGRRATPAGTPRRLPRGAVPVVAAVAAAAVWWVGDATGVTLAARSGAATRTVGVVDVVVAAVVVALLGWAVRALVARSRRGRPGNGERAWFVLCGVVLLVSLLGPLGGTTPGAVAVLLAEHVAVGAVVALGLRR
ncbi:DUF6069 family protein [Cellulomonas wangsupingiae]|uniref:DUF6069 family protein n=1 Tax=Cellulomonas wangsupingiae TaxID=2968085 RepID=A0ABY5K1S8_9CELL|nr:DUF6069 family protein [Cellulomonas wangsupingiae]MCC2335449.1 DUF6069 family protein [Cellulomonas wangsupingiae]UUI64377.1 DUF6069 family protein [Cellulomonas wangsupingiae]